MSKTLKIGGIAILVLLALLGIKALLFQTFIGPSTKSLSIGRDSLEILGQSAGQSAGLSSPMQTMNSLRSEKMAVAPEAISTYDMQTETPQTPVQDDKKIIKNGDLNLKVDSADEAAQKISEIAKVNGGEVFSSNFYQLKNNVKNGTVTVKVPVANFEKTFAELKKIATLVVRESTSGLDATQEYVDLKAQLSNRQAEEQSFVRILDQAQKIDDVLAVTRELARVRGNIEQLQGRIKYLESQTDMSTISVNLTEDEDITIVDSWRPWQVVKDSFNALIKGLQVFADSIIRFIVVVVPFLLIWGVILWAIYIIGKKIYLRVKNSRQND